MMMSGGEIGGGDVAGVSVRLQRRVTMSRSA